MSSFYLLSTTTVTRWFGARRGLALALVLVGFNLGYISAGPLAAWLIEQLGWRIAYATLGIGCGLIPMLAAPTLRLPRADEVEGPAYARGAVGGRIGSGAVSDWLGTVATVRAGYLLQLVALLLLLRLSAHAALLGSLVLLGMGFAAAETMLAKAVPEVFGMRALGAI